MAPDPLRSKIVKTFKLHGLSLRSEGSTYLQSVLREAERSEVDEALSRIIDVISNLNLPSPVIDRPALESAVGECNDDVQPENSERVFNVINAFSTPRYKYHQERKKLLAETSPKSLFGCAADKTRLIKDRYWLVEQRTTRHELFTPAVQGSMSQASKFLLQTVEQVLGQQGEKKHTIVLAMLVQMEEGKYYLEDASAYMQCDLSSAKFHLGMFTEYTFVLAEGTFDDVTSLFKVSGVGLPPPEPARITRSYFGNGNFFGGPAATAVSGIQLLKDTEKERADAMFIMVSDVWLDQPTVMAKLKTMFTGYSKQPPFAFVFFGNFTSGQNNENTVKQMKEGFRALADLLKTYPSLCSDSHFLFVPGPQDPGPGPVLPRPPLPACLTEPLTKTLTHAHMCSNPVRVQYCSQEIVLFRENLINKMCRHCIRFPARTDELHVHLAKTLLSQGHLTPLPLHAAPVYWSHDHALKLYPIPDVVVVADKYDAFSVQSTDCIVFNPGSFPKSNFSFKVYMPAQKKIENCEISS